ncbi:MAG: DUF502 domain-containing protein [Calditrichaeota bacterium]|nr:MAG: DUF502 domain-containing protein [Calditrichota bacterium]
MKNSKPLVPKGSIGRKFRAYFFTGLLVLIPLFLTGYIIWNLFLAIDGILRGVVYDFLYKTFGLEVFKKPIPGLGFITLVLLITFTGIIARNYFGRKIVDIGDRIVQSIPLINRVYNAIKQISYAFFSEKREVFKKAILFEYPRKGIYSIGFFTQDTRGPVQEALEEDVVSVFLPTTPNPTSGFLLFVPKTDIIDLDLPVEEALKLIISGGAIVPAQNLRGKAEVREFNRIKN